MEQETEEAYVAMTTCVTHTRGLSRMVMLGNKPRAQEAAKNWYLLGSPNVTPPSKIAIDHGASSLTKRTVRYISDAGLSIRRDSSSDYKYITCPKKSLRRGDATFRLKWSVRPRPRVDEFIYPTPVWDAIVERRICIRLLLMTS